MSKEINGVIHTVKVIMSSKYDDRSYNHIMTFVTDTLDINDDDCIIANDIIREIKRKYERDYYIDEIAFISICYTDALTRWNE